MLDAVEREPAHQPAPPITDPLDQHGDALPAADGARGDAEVARRPPVADEPGEQPDDEQRAGRAPRVPERDRAALRADPLGVGADGSSPRASVQASTWPAKASVTSIDVDVVERGARARASTGATAGTGPMPGQRRVDADDGRREHPQARHPGRRARRRRTSATAAAPSLMPHELPAVDRAAGAEGRAQPRQPPASSRRGRSSRDDAADRDQLGVEDARGARGEGAGVRAGGVRVLPRAAHAAPRGERVGGGAHLRVGEPGGANGARV